MAKPEANRPFRLSFEVRDYECDLQGIVNNAAYLQYLEHTRHQFLKRFGLSFAALAQSGVNLVVVRSEIDYHSPLRSGDSFVVELLLERPSPVRFAFRQEIHRKDGRRRTLIASAKILCAAVDGRGRPLRPTVLQPLFQAYGLGG